MISCKTRQAGKRLLVNHEIRIQNIGKSGKITLEGATKSADIDPRF